MASKFNPLGLPALVRAGVAGMCREIGQMRGSNVWTFILYGLMFDMLNNLWRPFAVVFLERLGGSAFEIALLSALPGLVAAIVLLPGAILFRKFTNKKRATAAFIMISRACLLVIAFVPALPNELQPLLFVVLVALMNCPDALSQTSLQSLLGEIFSGTTRGQAIALRTKFGQAIIPVVTISAGLAITFIPSTEEQRMIMYQIFFIGAFLLGLVEVWIFNQLKSGEAAFPREGTLEAAPLEPSPLATIRAISKDKTFRAFVAPAILFAFTWQAGWPLVSIHQAITLGATEIWFAVFALVTGFSAFLSGPFWQKLLRKYGNNTVFVVAAALLALNMFAFPIVPNVQIMTAVSVLGGISAIGINTALLNGVLGATPDKNRMMYLAFYNTVLNISLFIAPFIAHLLFSLVGNMYAMFIVGGLRFGATFVLWLSQRGNE
ncbi:MAG: MFS transporter [Defluviitaleaceae bacterium]|nr:MFS transporter [Defluviitaleaceae bacterium]